MLLISSIVVGCDNQSGDGAAIDDNASLNDVVNESLQNEDVEDTSKTCEISYFVLGKEYLVVESLGNEIIGVPSDPNVDGYIFVGWYLDNDTFINEFNSAMFVDSSIDSDFAVYAKMVEDREEIRLAALNTLAGVCADISVMESKLENCKNDILDEEEEWQYYLNKYEQKQAEAESSLIQIYRSDGGFSYEPDPSLLAQANKYLISANEEEQDYIEACSNYDEIKEDLYKLYEIENELMALISEIESSVQ